VLRDIPVYSPGFRQVLIPACAEGRLRLSSDGGSGGGMVVVVAAGTVVLGGLA